MICMMYKIILSYCIVLERINFIPDNGVQSDKVTEKRLNIIFKMSFPTLSGIKFVLHLFPGQYYHCNHLLFLM